MASAFINLADRPYTAIINAVTMHPKADDFCRELSLRSLFDCSVIGAAIVYPDSNTDITVVGRYGSQEIAGSLSELKESIENATRRKHLESMTVVRNVGGVPQVALIPSPPTAATAGVICLFFSDESAEITIDLETQVALAFACEMYCSPFWGFKASNSRGKWPAAEAGVVASLTNRQMMVLELIANGKTNERIAKVLNYSVATIKNDISAVFRFLGVSDRNDAVVEATNRGLLPPPPEFNSVNLTRETQILKVSKSRR